MDGFATFAKLKADADEREMRTMDYEEEEVDEEDDSSNCILGCWKSFLPTLQLGQLIMDAPPPQKSVSFQLDHNTTHLVTPWFTCPNVHFQDLFFGRYEIHATELDMEATATYFRRLYRLERVRKDGDQEIDDAPSPPPRLQDVSTIGLEWLIWPDNRWKRRHDMVDAIQCRYYYSTRNKKMKTKMINSLAYKCQVISQVSKKEARERAEWVVHELNYASKNSSATTTTTAPSTNKSHSNKHHQATAQMLYQKGVLMNKAAAVATVPTEIYIPVAVWCTTPAA